MKGKFYEYELEEMICNDLQNNNGKKICERGFSLGKKDYQHLNIESVYQQFSLGNYGIADILALGKFQYGNFQANIGYLMELKAVPLETDDVFQILKYRRGLMSLLNEAEEEQLFGFNTRLYLIGRGLSNSFMSAYTIDVLEKSGISIFTYDFCIENGLKFNNLSQITYALEAPGYDSAKEILTKHYEGLENE